MKKKYFYLIAGILFCTGITILVYYYIRQTIPHADTNLAARGIETTSKLFLNGYLGILFGFKYSGNINWLIIVLSLVYLKLYGIKSIKKADVAFGVFLVLSFGLISIKGFFNPRYQYTLTLLFVFLVNFLVWKMFHKSDFKIMKIMVVYLFLLVGFNFYLEAVSERFQREFEKIFGDKQKVMKKKKNKSDNVRPPDVLFVNNLLSTIDTMKTENYFLVNNLPDFYYYTHKKGHYYWCGDDNYYSKTGNKKLFNKKDINDIRKTLVDSMNCQYIYTYKGYFNYNPKFDEFIKKCCKLIIYDKDDRMVYQIN